MNWINSQNELPKDCGFVLCAIEEVNDLGISRYIDLRWFDEEKFLSDKPCRVTHWMPLPEKPKE